MPSRPRRIHPRETLLIIALALATGFSAAARAADPAPPEQAAAEAPAPSRTYAAHGATISWDVDNERFHAPTAEQAARIAEGFRETMAKRLADGKGPLAPAGKVAIEKMADGTRKARLTPDQLNASLVRFDAEGELAGSCSQGAQPYREILAAPVASRVEEK